MKFPHAYKGVKKLFIAEILGVIMAVLMITAAVLVAIGLKNEPALLAGGTVGLVGSIIMIVMFVLQLIGLIQGGKDEPLIKIALFFTLAAIVLSLVATILASFPDNQILAVIARICNIGVDGATVIAFLYTLLGISNLATRLGDEEMARRGKGLVKIVLVLYIVSIILGIYGTTLTGGNFPEWVRITVVVAGIVAAIAELIVYLLTFIYYGQATKMLKK